MYKKSQYGWLLIVMVLTILGFLFLAYTYQWGDFPLPFLPFLLLSLLFVFVFLLFYKLTIEIRSSGLRLIYGIGIVSIAIDIDQLKQVESIKTRWYWGLGIRITPKGMLYNIQGLKAVRLEYISKGKHKKVMVGSPEPEKLALRLKQVFGTMHSSKGN